MIQQFLKRIKHTPVIQLSNPMLRYLGKIDENTYSHTHTKRYVNVYGDFNHNDPNLEITQVSSTRWRDTVVHPYNEILLSNKKELAADTQNNIDGSQGYYAA